MSNDDAEVLDAMVAYGGGFVSALGKAGWNADEENLRRIKEAWPEYWLEYTNIAKVVRQKQG